MYSFQILDALPDVFGLHRTKGLRGLIEISKSIQSIIID